VGVVASKSTCGESERKIWLSRVQGGREGQPAGMRDSERRDEKNPPRVDHVVNSMMHVDGKNALRERLL
jgi:hypothetical protein